MPILVLLYFVSWDPCSAVTPVSRWRTPLSAFNPLVSGMMVRV
jgi:hypothetical protein